MKSSRLRRSSAIAAGFCGCVLAANVGQAQLVPDATNPIERPADAVKDNVPKDIPAKDTVDRAANTTKEATKDAADKAEKVTERAADTAKEATRDAREAVREGADKARDTAKDVRDNARDAADKARDVGRDVKEGVRDAADAGREAGRTARDSARDAVGVARDAIREARREFRGADVRGPDIGLWFNRSTNDGLVIADVAAEGAIARVGFHEGDRIVSVNGRKVVRERDFLDVLFHNNVRRDRVSVIVMRDGAEQTIYVEPAVLVEQYETVRHDPLDSFGIVLDDRYDNRIVVWRVIPRSPAFYAGIRTGDIISSFNGQRISTGKELGRLVADAKPGYVSVEVSRGDKTRKLEAELSREGRAAEARTALRPNYDERSDRREERRDERRDRAKELQDDRKERRDERQEDRPSRSDGARATTPQVTDNEGATYESNRRGILRRGRR